MTTQTLPDLSRAALVLVDPQIDLLSPKSVVWDLFGDSVTKTDLVNKLKRLRAAAKHAGIPVMYAHIAVDERDYDALSPKNALQSLMKERKMCVTGQGASFHDELLPDDSTVVLSARQGPSAFGSDFEARIREHGRDTVILAGMVANLCVESHARDAMQMGFETFVISDALGALSDRSLDSTLETLSLLASGSLTTNEFVDQLER